MAVIRALNVAEKPSVAKAVSQILSRGQYRTREGLSVYNKVFEFNYTVGNQQVDMLMTSVSGHLMELDFEDQYRKWHSCQPVQLYDLPVHKKVPQDKYGLRDTLHRESRNCQWLVLWLDCDREGENIAYEVIQVCQERNPRLNIFRARFSALVERDIHQAMQTLQRPNPRFADAVDARQEIDLRIGASFTRFQTLLLAKRFEMGFHEEEKVILSYGPCQFPTLGFVVERYWQIQNYVPEDFWYIHVQYHSQEDRVSANFTWQRGHMFDHLAATVLYEMCVEQPTATVMSVDGRDTRKYPPHPLNTVELQKRASRYLRIGSEQVMKLAEELYQWGFISYPRTETDHFQDGIDLQGIVQEHTQHPQWGAYASRLLDPQEGLWRAPGDGGHDDQAHPPIHPTKAADPGANWTAGHRKVYELVVRHFLACVSQPAVGFTTTVIIDIAGETFTAHGLMITARNYLDVYIWDHWGDSNLPNFQQGQQFQPTELTLKEGRTAPPNPLTEAELIGLMDKAGIGTDATMHDHIKKLTDRSYAVKDNRQQFTPTPLGEALVMGYDGMGYELWKPFLRAGMERDMKLVGEGAKSKAEVLQTSLHAMRQMFSDANLQKDKLVEAMSCYFERNENAGAGAGRDNGPGELVRPCPQCQSSMFLKTRAGGAFMIGCSGYPQCRNVMWLPAALIEASVTEQTCPTCQPGPVHLVHFKFRRGEIPVHLRPEFAACIGCDRDLKELLEVVGTAGPFNAAAPGRGAGAPGGPARGGARGNGAGRGNPGRGRGTAPERGPGALSCFRCGQEGHLSSNCPDNQPGAGAFAARGGAQGGVPGASGSGQGAPGGAGCFLCNQTGHFATACPNRGGRAGGRGTGGGGTGARGGGGQACFKCGEEGHFASACPGPGNGGGGSTFGGARGGFGAGGGAGFGNGAGSGFGGGGSTEAGREVLAARGAEAAVL
ncbi:DNA topoisomerase III [Klebsormidium nitens]|uniref:DNA topoisomerase n=1 Tax=Klebsormidium nitens TaxID=105231 RepID=A0A1Y1I738_KLENI|nr:DNA topoisomerase III [Klebsormidium nitens]|eukprot:GAQ86760.1 DNA topoisomerase III [Klebsormidium nitens]